MKRRKKTFIILAVITVLFCVPGIFFWVSSANSLGAVSRYSSNFALITVT